MRVNVAVQVGAGQNDDEWKLRMRFVKAADRFVAASCVQGDQHIAAPALVRLVQIDFVSKMAEDAQPSDGRNFVAVVDTERRRRDELNVHVV